MAVRALAICLLPAGPVLAADTRVERQTGYARASADGALLYTETHEDRYSGADRVHSRVTFQAPDGTLIAEKEVDFSAGRYAPELTLSDHRSGRIEAAHHVDGRLQLLKRSRAGKPARTALLDPGPSLVVDAGLEELIRARWEAIRADTVIEVNIAVPSYLRAIPFRVRRLGTARVDGVALTTVRLEPSSFVIRLLAPQIDITFRDDDRSLYRYEGVTALRAPAGGNYRATVDFPRRPAGD